MNLPEQKDAARKAAFARRKLADPTNAVKANAHLVEAVRQIGGSVVSGFWPIRTEIDPRPAMEVISVDRHICLPVVQGAGQPLVFRNWQPRAAMEEGAFGAAIPKDETLCVPDILIVPLAAFDEKGYRLGYGGGFYDRTLEGLRANGRAMAIGFAYDVQLSTDPLPIEPTDQPLDAMVTESGIIWHQMPGPNS